MRTSCDQYKFTAAGPIIYVPQTVEPPENAFLWNGYDYKKQEWVFEGKKDTRTLEELLASRKKSEQDRPEEGKVYALTGGLSQPSIANGNTWRESEVKN